MSHLLVMTTKQSFQMLHLLPIPWGEINWIQITASFIYGPHLVFTLDFPAKTICPRAIWKCLTWRPPKRLPTVPALFFVLFCLWLYPLDEMLLIFCSTVWTYQGSPSGRGSWRLAQGSTRSREAKQVSTKENKNKSLSNFVSHSSPRGLFLRLTVSIWQTRQCGVCLSWGKGSPTSLFPGKKSKLNNRVGKEGTRFAESWSKK